MYFCLKRKNKRLLICLPAIEQRLKIKIDVLQIPFYSYLTTKMRDREKPLDLERYQFQKRTKLPLNYVTESILIP